MTWRKEKKWNSDHEKSYQQKSETRQVSEDWKLDNANYESVVKVGGYRSIYFFVAICGL
jgi:hypothetical protein